MFKEKIKEIKPSEIDKNLKSKVCGEFEKKIVKNVKEGKINY